MFMLNIEDSKLKIKELAEKYSLSLVVLFGSQATGAVHTKSDVDIAALGANSLDRFALANDLDKVFERNDVEVIDMNGASPTMMYVLVRDGKLLYENTIGAFMKWKFYAIREWINTAWLRKLSDKKLIEWARVV